MVDRVKQLIELLTEILRLAQEMSDLNAQFRQTLAEPKFEQLVKDARNFTSRFAELLAKQQDMIKQALEVAKSLSETPSAGSAPVAAGDIAKHFRSVIDAIQLDARKPQQGATATTLKSLDIELKGLIVVENDEARIVTPAPNSTINPAHLSTVRMSFGSIPLVRTETEALATPDPSPDQPK